ncbi:unnamed protein product [Miscanthus lutarioriparius]|uniref:Uncharacterized protein n=1 Tax=Miscanthus lutarioriparius TaxID=422564 RepID=A0A811MAE0_9POAL|nr:unnamed protein product [Miscanthus lutarioriparius]
MALVVAPRNKGAGLQFLGPSQRNTSSPGESETESRSACSLLASSRDSTTTPPLRLRLLRRLVDRPSAPPPRSGSMASPSPPLVSALHGVMAGGSFLS